MNYQLIDEEKVIIQRLEENDFPIYVYGMGEAAGLLTKFINSQGFSVTAYCVDNAYYRDGITFQSKPVIPIEKLKTIKTEYHLFLAIGNMEVMKKIVAHNPFEHDLYLTFDYVRMWRPDQSFCDTYKERFAYLAKTLADSFSRDTLWSWLEAKITGKVKALLPYCIEGQYFNSLIKVRGGGAFVDCGAYDGDTIKKYIEFFNGYQKIYAFEPDKKNFIKLKDNTMDLEGIECINKGVWDQDDILHFEANGDTGSAVSSSGKVSVPVTSIDKTVGNEKVYFIKMDVEGSELQALHGAKKTIKRYMPVLAICVYHCEADLLEIPKYIMGFNNEKCKYNLYLRHHSCTSAELVLYAIPTYVLGSEKA